MFSKAPSPAARQSLLAQMLLSVVLANMNPVFAKVLFGVGWTPLALYIAVLIVIVVVLLMHEVMIVDRKGRWTMTRGDVVGTLVAAIGGGVLAPLLFYEGLRLMTASESIILTGTLPFFVVCFAVLLLKERFRSREIIGGLFILGGFVFLLRHDIAAFRLSAGVPLLLGSTVASAFTIIMHKKLVTHRHLDSIILIRNVLSLLLVCIWAAVREPGTFGLLLSPQNVWLVLALPIVCYLLPYYIYFVALKKLTAMDAGVMEATGRVVGLVAAGAILGEQLTTDHFISVICVIFGIIFVNVPLTRIRIAPSRLMGLGPLRR